MHPKHIVLGAALAIAVSQPRSQPQMLRTEFTFRCLAIEPGPMPGPASRSPMAWPTTCTCSTSVMAASGGQGRH
jgi:hypothetical protein